MSTTSTESTAAAPMPATSKFTPTVGSVLRAELTRIRSRRLIQVLLVAYLLGLLLGGVGTFLTTHRIGAQERAAATVQAQQALAECQRGLAANEPPQACPADAFTPDRFFTHRPARPDDVIGHAIGVGVGFALVAFLIGCTAGGAEWSQKTMPALLFWEPRRVRLILIKGLALILTTLTLAVGAQLLWSAIEVLVFNAHGYAALPSHFWSDLIGTQLRLVGLALIAVVGAFGLANLTRNTGAALGAAFVYLALAETAVRIVRPALNPFLLTSNIGGFLAKGGLDVPTTNHQVYDDNGIALHVVHLGAGRAGATLALYALVVFVAATVVFRRRDVT